MGHVSGGREARPSRRARDGASPVKAPHLLALTAIIFTSASAQNVPIPRNSVSCEGFSNMPDGNWVAGPNVKPFDIGYVKRVTVSNVIIPRGIMKIDGVDVRELLNEKCG
jgi:hypothetical protein